MTEISKDQNLFKTFLSYSVPCIISMFLTSFITIVDGFFIGWKMGEKGLAAVNLTLPVLYILLALTIMAGVGGVTLGAQSLGAKNNRQASQSFSMSIAVNIAVNICAMLVLVLFRDPVIHLLHAKGEMYGYVKDFLGTMTFFYIFMMMNMTFSMFIRSEGKPQLSLFFGIAGNILNIILDYIFIIKLGYGMRGAALASGISVLIPFILSVLYFISGKSVYKFTRFKFTLSGLGTMLYNGSSEFVAQISGSITISFFNYVIIGRIGVGGVAAMTIVGYVSFIQNMVLTGIAVGVHPLISYHYGANNRKIILGLLSIALKSVFVIGITVFIVSLAGADGIVSLFSKNDAGLEKIAVPGLRLYSIAFLLNGYNIIAAAYFTSLGNAKVAALISMLRSLVLIIFFILVLPRIIGNTGIWLTAPLTEAVTFILAFMCIRRSEARMRVENTGCFVEA